MKRSIISILAGLLILLPLTVFATGTATVGAPIKVNVQGQTQRIVIPVTFTADSSATEATVTLNPTTYGITGWYLYQVQTVPGTPGPTNGAWDLDITDARSEVISRNLIDDRSSTLPQTVFFNSGYPMIVNTWTLSIGDNAVNSAVVVVYLTFVSN